MSIKFKDGKILNCGEFIAFVNTGFIYMYLKDIFINNQVMYEFLFHKTLWPTTSSTPKIQQSILLNDWDLNNMYDNNQISLWSPQSIATLYIQSQGLVAPATEIELSADIFNSKVIPTSTTKCMCTISGLMAHGCQCGHKTRYKPSYI